MMFWNNIGAKCECFFKLSVKKKHHFSRVREVKAHLIQTVGDLLQGELSFIHLIQETIPEVASHDDNKVPLLEMTSQQQNDNVQNGDLTEADQDCLGQNELEDEGAVGGVLNHEDGLNVPVIDFPGNGEGLDQVPTRLPTKIKSGTNTPTGGMLFKYTGCLFYFCFFFSEPY